MDRFAQSTRFGADCLPVERAVDSPWIDKLVAHFVRLGESPEGAFRLVESSDAVVSTLRQAVDHGHWEAALDLVRVAEPAFALGARWGAWASTLDMGLLAARALGDTRVEARLLHEKGVRAMALAHFDEADEALSQALASRTALGSEDEIGCTRSQLAQLRALTRAAG